MACGDNLSDPKAMIASPRLVDPCGDQAAGGISVDVVV